MRPDLGGARKLMISKEHYLISAVRWLDEVKSSLLWISYDPYIYCCNYYIV